MANMYFIAIVLPATLNEQVLVYKKYMEEKYGCRVGLKSPAHITLVPPFWMEAEKEVQLVRDLDGLAGMMHCFAVRTANFAAFRPRTIFIAIAPNQELDAARVLIDRFFKNHAAYPVKMDTRPFHPHITIATRDLHKKAFQEAWPYFAEQAFCESWLAEGISLLRHNKKNWDVIHTSQFKKISEKD